MNKTFLAVAIALLSMGFTSNAQNHYSVQIGMQATEMSKYLLTQNDVEFSKYVIPEIMEKMGGREKFLQIMADLHKEFTEGGMIIKSVDIGQPGAIIDTANTLQCIVPEITVMTSSQGNIKQTSSLLAFSTDKGNTWKFVDYIEENAEQLRTIIPTISCRHKPPPRETVPMK